jgi:hypothetical protein
MANPGGGSPQGAAPPDQHPNADALLDANPDAHTHLYLYADRHLHAHPDAHPDTYPYPNINPDADSDTYADLYAHHNPDPDADLVANANPYTDPQAIISGVCAQFGSDNAFLEPPINAPNASSGG